MKNLIDQTIDNISHLPSTKHGRPETSPKRLDCHPFAAGQTPNEVNRTRWRRPVPDILASCCTVRGSGDTSAIFLTQSNPSTGHKMLRQVVSVWILRCTLREPVTLHRLYTCPGVAPPLAQRELHATLQRTSSDR